MEYRRENRFRNRTLEYGVGLQMLVARDGKENPISNDYGVDDNDDNYDDDVVYNSTSQNVVNTMPSEPAKFYK